MQVLLKVFPERRVAIGQAADIRVLRPIVALMKQAVPYRDRETGELRRHHLHETVLQRAVHCAVKRVGITKPASCHSLRHYTAYRIIPCQCLQCRFGRVGCLAQAG